MFKGIHRNTEIYLTLYLRSQIYSNTNYGNTDQEAQYSTSIGVTQTESTSQTITTTVSTEIGGAFKAFSASVSTSIENSWQVLNLFTRFYYHLIAISNAQPSRKDVTS